MKNIILLLCVLIALTSAVEAQKLAYKSYVPNSLSSSTILSGRTLSTTYADTSEPLRGKGYEKAFVRLNITQGDSCTVLIAFQYSNDGTNFNSLAVQDSIVNTTNAVYPSKNIEVPAACLAAESFRFRIYGALWGKYSANPSALITAEVLRR